MVGAAQKRVYVKIGRARGEGAAARERGRVQNGAATGEEVGKSNVGEETGLVGQHMVPHLHPSVSCQASVHNSAHAGCMPDLDCTEQVYYSWVHQTQEAPSDGLSDHCKHCQETKSRPTAMSDLSSSQRGSTAASPEIGRCGPESNAV